MKKTFRLGFILTGLLFLSACQNNQILVEQRILSFGTLIDLTIATTKDKKYIAEQAINDVEQLLKKRHHQWHAWRKGDLSAVNQSLQTNTAPVRNKDIELLVLRSKEYYTQTNGLFNPAIGQLIEAWGFHSPAEPNYPLIHKISINIPNMDQISINDHVIKSKNPYAQLDFGGIAKGLAIEQIQAIFNKNNLNNYLINIGGDLNASGTKHSTKWIAGIQNPYEYGAIATLTLDDKSNLFTSGDYQRYTIKNKKRLHHIIDPRTGQPSQQANAVTVYHPNALTADVAATALMIAKPTEWQSISQNLGLEDYLIIMPDKSIWVSKHFFSKLTFNTELKIHIIDEQH